MAKVKWSGKTAQNLKEIGIMVMQMDMGHSNFLMEMFIGESGLTISVMDMVLLWIKMETDMKGLGKTIYRMVKELKLWLMEVGMKDSMLKAKSKDMESINGLIKLFIKENGAII